MICLCLQSIQSPCAVSESTASTNIALGITKQSSGWNLFMTLSHQYDKKSVVITCQSGSQSAAGIGLSIQ